MSPSEPERALVTNLEHPGDWALMTRLLTLDLTRELRSYLDLEVSDYGALVQVLRKVVEEEPEASDSDPPSTLGENALRRVETELGPEDARALHIWGSTAFRHAYRDKRRYDFWSIFLGQCRWNDELWAALELPPKHDQVFKNRFLNSQEDSRFLADYNKATTNELTRWDLQMRLDDAFHDAGNDPSVPEILLGGLAAVQRNRQFWSWTVATLSTTSLADLRRNATSLVETRPQFSFIASLESPAELANPSEPPLRSETE